MSWLPPLEAMEKVCW